MDFEEILEPEYRAAGMDIALLECCTGKGIGGEVLQVLGAWLIDEPSSEGSSGDHAGGAHGPPEG